MKIMKKSNIWIFAFMLLLVFACRRKGEDPTGHFDQIYTLNAKRLDMDTYKLCSFGRMIPFEQSQCILKENYIGSSLIDQLYLKKDSIRTFAQMGEGPDEYVMPRLMQKIGDSSVNLYDMQKKQVITKGLSHDISRIMPIQCMPLSILEINDGYLVSGLMDQEEDKTQRYALLDHEGVCLKSFGAFPDDENNSKNKSKALAYQGWMVYNPSLNRFASVTSSGAIFELYQIEAEPMLLKKYHDIFPLYTEENHLQTNGIRHGKDNTIGYTDLYATERYIYALYSGKKIAQHDDEGMMNAMLSNRILVYDWEGRCICQLHTDKELFNICVTDNDTQLIALGWEDEYVLYAFDFFSMDR